MKKSFVIKMSISDLTNQKELLNQLILMKNFIEKKTLKCIGTFMLEGPLDSIEDTINSLKSIKSVLNSISTYEKLFESVENEEFGKIGIVCLSDFFEGYSEFLSEVQ